MFRSSRKATVAKSVFNSYAFLVVATLEHNNTIHSNYITSTEKQACAAANILTWSAGVKRGLVQFLVASSKSWTSPRARLCILSVCWGIGCLWALTMMEV